MATRFRGLPAVDRVLSDRRVRRLVKEYSHGAVLELIRAQLDEARAAVRDGQDVAGLEQVVLSVEDRATAQWRLGPIPIINATGVILHTNLGRAPLSTRALEAIGRAAAGYSDLELVLTTGRRSSRQLNLARLLCQLTGAEAALVVNNNASAMLLGLSAVAAGKEVVVSRGEAVEIGGGFRIPDVLRQSGAELVEVGTTNRTYVRDYEEAISERTGAFLSVHTSNFRVTGFTHTPPLAELVDLGKDRKIPVLHDLGSGCLLDTSAFGLAHEPMPQESIAAGAGLAFFSGDKLLGGPQAGIIVGNTGLINALSKHPLARAVRIDKLSIAALAATLLHYIRDEATREVPVWRMLTQSEEELGVRAGAWQAALGSQASAVEGLSTIGGGSLPGEVLPTTLVRINPDGDVGGAEGLAGRLRQSDPPVVARIEDEHVFLDPRTVLPGKDEALLKVVSEALTTPDGK